jgi:hypothetical protein
MKYLYGVCAIIYGDLQGIAGRTMQEISGLDFMMIEADKTG